MSKLGRREFLRTMSSVALAAASLPLPIRRALAIPAHRARAFSRLSH
jgi:hypothetical protein